MKKILITGASGFIGTNLLEHFKENYIVRNIDFNIPKKQDISLFRENIDITNYSEFEKSVLEFSPDYIVHLAARTDLQGKILEDYSANTIGVKNLLKIVELLPNLRKVVLASSLLVCLAGYCPKDQFDYAPTTVYGESKVETEKIVWANKPHCDWAIIRPTSIWGPWFGEPYRNFFDMVMERRYFHIGNFLSP